MANLLGRLLGPVNLANGTATAATVPASHTWTLKHIRIVNNTAAAITVKVGIGGVTDAKLFVQAISIPAGETYVENLQITMIAAETLQANTTATGLTITVNGIDQT
jgi:hypothetical protein